jgi:hypothetical protein
LWVTGWRCGYVTVATGLPRITADLLHVQVGVVGPVAAIALWYRPLQARGLDEVIEGEQLAPVNDLM